MKYRCGSLGLQRGVSHLARSIPILNFSGRDSLASEPARPFFTLRQERTHRAGINVLSSVLWTVPRQSGQEILNSSASRGVYPHGTVSLAPGIWADGEVASRAARTVGINPTARGEQFVHTPHPPPPRVGISPKKMPQLATGKAVAKGG